MKLVAFKTVGCRLNQAETAQIAAQFEASGYRIVPFGEPCDLCVIHTCTVTKNAEKTCIRLARSLKKSNSNPFVVLAGCAVEIDCGKLQQESGADMLAGQRDKFRLVELLEDVPRGRAAQTFRLSGSAEAENVKAPTPFPRDQGAGVNILPHFTTTRALVKIQDGCDFGCAYCIVPLARGRPKSRLFSEIIDEVEKLAEHGYREIVLTGANMGCYKNGARRLVDLIEKIETIQQIERIRLSSIEVSTTERAIIDFMAESLKLCRYIHVPLQSGDDRILSSMGRRYTAKEYRELIEYAVEKIPLLGLGTDILVGLPGEDDAAFANTVSMVKDLPFSNLHVFPYSRRPGTKAANMPKHVSNNGKKQRVAFLIETGQEKRRSFAEKFIGRKVSVLIERINRHGRGWTGEYLEAGMSATNLKPNQIVEFIPKSYEAGILL